MKTIWISTLAAVMLLSHPVLAQNDAAALETALRGKPLALRSYCADPVAKYTWYGDKLLPGAMDLHGVNAFFSDTVRLKAGKILIEGQSSTLVRGDGGKLAPMGRTPMRLEIDLQGADPATVFPQVQAAVFFPNMKAALDGLPVFASDMLPFSADGTFHSTCNCSHILQEGKWVSLEPNSTKLTSPGFIKKVSDSAVSQKAIDLKVSGSLTLIYLISETGRVDEVWLAKPLGGPELAELAARLGRENQYRPATYEGKPVGTVLVQSIPF